MKYVLLAVITLSALVGAKTYTLDQLLEKTYENSGALKIIKKEMAKAEAQIKEAKGGAAPKLDASANYQYAFDQYNPTEGSMDDFDPAAMQQQLDYLYANDTITLPALTQAGAYNPTLQNADSLYRYLGPSITGKTFEFMSAMFSNLIPTYDHTVALTLSLQQPLFAQGKVSIGLRIAKEYRSTIELRYDQSRDSLGVALTKLFYGALLAQNNATIQQEAIALAKESHRLSVLRWATGKGSVVDTLMSRLNYEKALVERRNAESTQKMALEAIIKQTGIVDTPQEMHIEGEFPAADYAIDEDDALEKMRSRNRVLKQLQSGEEIQRQLVHLATSDYLPMVYCGASLGKLAFFNEFDQLGDKAYWHDDQKVFIGATMNLFSGLKRHQKIKQATADYEKFSETKSLATDGLELGVKNAHEQLKTKAKELESVESILNLAQKGYDITKKAYEVGSKTLFDLQKAEIELKQAKLAHNAALFGYHSAVVDLKLLMGEF